MSAVHRPPDDSSALSAAAAAAAAAQKPKGTATFKEGVLTLQMHDAEGKPFVRQIPVSVGGKTADPLVAKRYAKILISVFSNIEAPENIQEVALLKNGNIRIKRMVSEGPPGTLPKLVSSILTPTSSAPPAARPPKSEEYASLVDHVHIQAKFTKELESTCKSYTAATVRKALDTILNEPHAHLVDGGKWTPTLADCLQKAGNEGLRAALQNRAETPSAAGEKVDNLDSCQKDIIKFILSRMVKETKVIEDDTTRSTQTFVRGTGQSAPEKAFEANRSLSALGQRDQQQQRHCANLAIVRVTNKKDAEAITDTTLRSAATDTSDRLQELVRLSLMKELDACRGKDLTDGAFRKIPGSGDTKDNTFEFVHMISNYADPAEQDAVRDLVNKWPAIGFSTDVVVDGIKRTIKIKRPILESQPLSHSAVSNTSIQKQVDRSNFLGHQRLLYRCMSKYPPIDTDMDNLKAQSWKLAEKIADALGEGKEPKEYMGADGLIDFDKVPHDKLMRTGESLFGPSPTSVLGKLFVGGKSTLGVFGNVFASDEFKNYQTATAKYLLNKLKAAGEEEKGTLISLYAVLFRRMPPEDHQLPAKFDFQPKPEERCSAFQLEVFRHNLCVDLKLSKSVQCENGADKTSEGVAIREAAARFRAVNGGRACMPSSIPEEYVKEAMRVHGSGVAAETTGSTGVALSDELNKAQRNIKLTDADVKEVNNRACEILKKIGSENKAGEKLINARGELCVPIYKLGLTTNTKTESLKAEIDKINYSYLSHEHGYAVKDDPYQGMSPEQKRILLYALTSIYHLASERSASKVVAEHASDEEMVSFAVGFGDVTSPPSTSTSSILQGSKPRPITGADTAEATARSKALYEPIGREAKDAVDKDIKDVEGAIAKLKAGKAEVIQDEEGKRAQAEKIAELEKAVTAATLKAEKAKIVGTRGEQMKLAQAAKKTFARDCATAARESVKDAETLAQATVAVAGILRELLDENVLSKTSRDAIAETLAESQTTSQKAKDTVEDAIAKTVAESKIAIQKAKAAADAAAKAAENAENAAQMVATPASLKVGEAADKAAEDARIAAFAAARSIERLTQNIKDAIVTLIEVAEYGSRFKFIFRDMDPDEIKRIFIEQSDSDVALFIGKGNIVDRLNALQWYLKKSLQELNPVQDKTLYSELSAIAIGVEKAQKEIVAREAASEARHAEAAAAQPQAAAAGAVPPSIPPRPDQAAIDAVLGRPSADAIRDKFATQAASRSRPPPPPPPAAAQGAPPAVQPTAQKAAATPELATESAKESAKEPPKEPPSSEIFEQMVAKWNLTSDNAQVQAVIQKYKNIFEKLGLERNKTTDIYLEIMTRFGRETDQHPEKKSLTILKEICAEYQPVITQIKQEEKALQEAIEEKRWEDADRNLEKMFPDLKRSDFKAYWSFIVEHRPPEATVASILRGLLQNSKSIDFELVWLVISEYRPAESTTRALLQELERMVVSAADPSSPLKAILANYKALQQVPFTSEGERLQYAWFAAKHFPEGNESFDLNFSAFKQDLAQCAFSSVVTDRILERLQKCKNLLPGMYKKIQDTYKEIREHVQETHLQGSEALTTAIIMAHDIPTIQKVAERAFEGYVPHEESQLPKGWQLLKEEGRIYVISSHKLGEGTSKKAVTAVEMVLGNMQAAPPPRPVAHLRARVGDVIDRAQLRQEIEIHCKFGGKNGTDNFVRVHTVRQENQGKVGEVGMIVELCDATVDQAFKEERDLSPRSVLERLEVFADIAEGVAKMHSEDVVHGDIKGANCFVQKDAEGRKRGKLSDFGTSVYTGRPLPPWSAAFRRLPENERRIPYGSPKNSAPELWWAGKQFDFTPSINLKATDIWALGMLLKEMYDGVPFEWVKKLTTLDRVDFENAMHNELLDPLKKLEEKKQKEPLSAEEATKYQVYKLIAELFNLDPSERLRASEVVQATRAAIGAIRDLVPARAAAPLAAAPAPAATVAPAPVVAAATAAKPAAPVEVTVAPSVAAPAAEAMVVEAQVTKVPPPPPQPEPVTEAKKDAISVKEKAEELTEELAEERAARSKVLNAQKDAQKLADALDNLSALSGNTELLKGQISKMTTEMRSALQKELLSKTLDKETMAILQALTEVEIRKHLKAPDAEIGEAVQEAMQTEVEKLVVEHKSTMEMLQAIAEPRPFVDANATDAVPPSPPPKAEEAVQEPLVHEMPRGEEVQVQVAAKSPEGEAPAAEARKEEAPIVPPSIPLHPANKAAVEAALHARKEEEAPIVLPLELEEAAKEAAAKEEAAKEAAAKATIATASRYIAAIDLKLESMKRDEKQEAYAYFDAKQQFAELEKLASADANKGNVELQQLVAATKQKFDDLERGVKFLELTKDKKDMLKNIITKGLKARPWTLGTPYAEDPETPRRLRIILGKEMAKALYSQSDDSRAAALKNVQQLLPQLADIKGKVISEENIAGLTREFFKKYPEKDDPEQVLLERAGSVRQFVDEDVGGDEDNDEKLYQAIQALKEGELVSLQERGIVDNDGATPLHMLCDSKQMSEKQADIALKIINQGQINFDALNTKTHALGVTPFAVACSNGHLPIAQALIQKEGDKDKERLFVKDNKDNTPLQLICFREFEKGTNHSKIALKLIELATVEQLTHKNSNGKTALDQACERGHFEIADEIMKACLEKGKNNKDEEKNLAAIFEAACKYGRGEVAREIAQYARENGKGLDALLETAYKYKQEEIVTGILQAGKGLNPALLGRYEEIQKKGFEPLQALGCALLLEKHLPQGKASIHLDLKALKQDLAHSFFSDEAAKFIVESLNDPRIAEPSSESRAAIIAKFREIRAKVEVNHLHGGEALAAAILMAHDIPRVDALRQQVLSGRGYISLEGTIPEGWKLLKEGGKISVITGHALGKGTFKKATTVIQFIFNDAVAQSTAEGRVAYLEPKEPATLEEVDKQDFEHEIGIGEELSGSEFIAETHRVRSAAGEVGMFVEFCESDLEKALGEERDPSPQAVRSRLEAFPNILRGLVHMHEKGIAHLDVKLANCLLRDGKGKLGDFGTSKRSGEAVSDRSSFKVVPGTSYYGTPANTPPEIRPPLSVPLEQCDFAKMDVWAFGMMVKLAYDGEDFSWVEMMDPKHSCTRKWFEEQIQKELLDPAAELQRKKAAGELTTPKEKVQCEIYALLSKLLDPNPATRLTAKEALEATNKMMEALDDIAQERVG